VAVTIVYETHSITTDNEAGIATGWLPGELSPRGRALAADLGVRRRDDGIAAVFTSDLRRAVQTAEIAFTASGVPIYQDARLRECDYGDWNGMPVTRLAAERSRHIDVPWPGGQSYRQVVDQTRDFLRDLTAALDGARVLVIAHSANRWALDLLIGGVALEDSVDAPFEWREGWYYTVSAAGLARPGGRITTPRLELSPLTVGDADEMVEVLADPALYVFVGGEPPSLDALRVRYARLVVGHSPDGEQEWLNWIVRDSGGHAVGTVQATVVDGGRRAEIAWVIGTPWQGRGYASEAAEALVGWLGARGARRVDAHVHPGHHASIRVAARTGLRPTDQFDDGERLYVREITPPAPGERPAPA
jgi:broad specificity phosphatase PhoE/RimJ/RimL family protein N-acetyltransferase